MNSIKGFSSLIAETQFLFISHVMNILSKENSKDCIFKQILIHSNETEKLFFNKSFKSKRFHKCLQKFKKVLIEIRFPSKPFKSISKIQMKNITNIIIGIAFSDFPILNKSKCFSQNFMF